MVERPDWYEQTLASQRAMTAQTWDELVSRGVHEESSLQLEFYFAAPGRAAAEQLARFLDAETGYELAISDEADPQDEGWLVNGRTKRMRVSREILDEWVTRLVTAGAEHGGCKFDGWGTSLPGGLPIQ
jgi:regulator of RNase E activity RraB